MIYLLVQRGALVNTRNKVGENLNAFLYFCVNGFDSSTIRRRFMWLADMSNWRLQHFC